MKQLNEREAYTAIDPICAMTVDEASALHAERDGQAFFFCSDSCRQKFLSTPVTAKHEDKPPGKAIYTCPMHPEIEKDHPGDCPSATLFVGMFKINFKKYAPNVTAVWRIQCLDGKDMIMIKGIQQPPKVETGNKSRLKHDTSTNALIRRYKRSKERLHGR